MLAIAGHTAGDNSEKQQLKAKIKRKNLDSAVRKAPKKPSSTVKWPKKPSSTFKKPQKD